ncbi:MAG: Ig domain protein group 2 domain protein [Geminicoccaceae bacterium]|nr:Ig domain protein group 2 domain protein [Geminicoccaceae bacterium]
MSTIRRTLALLSVCTLFAAGCGDSSGPPAVASVDVSTPAGNLIVGESVTLTATPKDAAGNPLTGRTVGWSSSSASVATVTASNNAGVVTAVAPGTATITATVDGKSGTREITVLPPPVASVTVTAEATTIQAGATTQATALTRDAAGNVLTGRAIAWTTSAPAVASVSGTGLITGLTPGQATISASSEGQSGSTVVTVTPVVPGDAPQIASVTPNPMVEGQPATITGANFGASVGANIVRVGGIVAPVTAASATSLQIVVPALDCKPAQNIEIDVTVAGVTGAVKAHAFRPATTFTLAAGQQHFIANPAEFCLQFGASTANESYLIGVQSVSPTAASVTGVTVTAEAPPGSFVAERPSIASAPVFSSSLVSPIANARAERLRKHRAVESQIRVEDRAQLESRIRSRQSARRGAKAALSVAASQARVPTIPGTAKVGDVLNIRVPDRNANTCQNFIPIAVTVKALGTRAIFLEDNANPTGGLSAGDYETLRNQFDNQIYPTDVSYFGEPTDFDENSRIAIVITKEINKHANLLGVVYSANFASVDDCPSSNEGEVFYGKAPDPSGTVGAAYSTAEALQDAPIIIAHEFAHIIQIGRRGTFAGFTAFQTVWELEGQATFAEEANGYAVTGLQPGQNLGFEVAFNDPETVPTDWFVDGFVDLVVYYGFESQTSKKVGAPEQCSWLGTRTQGNDGPCLSGREVYGVPWSLLRWISDQYGPTFPGGEKGLHQKLIDNGFTGFATIADVVGQPIDVLLSRWAAALYVDDRVQNLDPKLRFTSWNLVAIENRLVQSARLQPRDRPFGAFSDQVSVRGGSTAYFIVSGGNRGAVAIRARDSAGATLPAVMRMWAVRMN